MDLVADTALHLRLLAGDPVASTECIERWLPQLERRLAGRYPKVAAADYHAITTAAIDALFDYIRNPERFDHTRGSLGGYLYMSARGDLLNALQRDRSQGKNASSLQDVEQSLADRNTDIEEEVANSVDAQWALEFVLSGMPDPLDRNILSLMLAGERNTSVYARALKIGHLPEHDQKSTVKRHKDRISKRLERLGEALHGR